MNIIVKWITPKEPKSKNIKQTRCFISHMFRQEWSLTRDDVKKDLVCDHLKNVLTTNRHRCIHSNA